MTEGEPGLDLRILGPPAGRRRGDTRRGRGPSPAGDPAHARAEPRTSRHHVAPHRRAVGAHPTPERRRQPEGLGLEAAARPAGRARAPRSCSRHPAATRSTSRPSRPTSDASSRHSTRPAPRRGRVNAGSTSTVPSACGVGSPDRHRSTTPTWPPSCPASSSCVTWPSRTGRRQRSQLGRHRELVPELEALVAQAPLRERRTALLMLALSRSGRQADALAAFRRLRARLVDELGLEPSAELRAVERAVLVPGRDRPPPHQRRWRRPGARDPGSSPERGGRARAGCGSRGRSAVVAAAVMAAVAWPSDDRRSSTHPSAVARLHPETGDVDGRAPRPRAHPRRDGLRPAGARRAGRVGAQRPRRDRLAGGPRQWARHPHGARWAPAAATSPSREATSGSPNPGDNTVTRVDGRSGAVVATIPVGLAPQGITSADGDVWVAIHRGEPSGPCGASTSTPTRSSHASRSGPASSVPARPGWPRGPAPSGSACRTSRRWSGSTPERGR